MQAVDQSFFWSGAEDGIQVCHQHGVTKRVGSHNKDIGAAIQ